MAQNNVEGMDLETKIVEVMAAHPKGVSNQILQEAVPSMSVEQLVNCLNKLITKNKIQLLKKGKQLVYMLKTSTSVQIEGGNIEEKVIFDAIQRAGNNGCTGKQIKFACNLPQLQINKILKELEAKKIIKSVMSNQKMKLYLLYDLEPSFAVTDSVFYNGWDIDPEFTKVLQDLCYKYLLQAKTAADEEFNDPILKRNGSLKSTQEIADYINNLKISKVNLNAENIEMILNTLIYDGKIEKLVTTTSNYKSEIKNLYRAVKPLIPSAALMRIPCGVCKLFQDCYPGGPVSPITCEYIKQWLDF